MRKWFSVELSRDKWEKFRSRLVKNGLRYESSGCFNLVHIEVFASPAEVESLNDFLLCL